MEQRWRSRLRRCTKVFAVGSAVLFILTTLLGWDTAVPVALIVVAVVLVLLVAVVDGVNAVNARTRRPD